MSEAEAIYRNLRKRYGRQGWWPVYNNEKDCCEYGVNAPRNDSDRFEIAIGAILTQNIAWVNVEKALGVLKKKRLLDPGRLHRADNQLIAECIRSTGYYNQKTIKIKNFLSWFKSINYSFDELGKMKTPAMRSTLLTINGVGPETADSILLYAMSRKIFVVDAYTKRIFSRLDLVSADDSYDSIQEFFHNNFKGSVKKYNEYHALIVAHGKDICKNRPLCADCCLNNICSYFNNKIL